jgi:hypothetical protein
MKKAQLGPGPDGQGLDGQGQGQLEQLSRGQEPDGKRLKDQEPVLVGQGSGTQSSELQDSFQKVNSRLFHAELMIIVYRQ